MGKVNQNSLKNWNDGQTINASDYKRERDLIVEANNDTHDRFLDVKLVADGVLEIIENNTPVVQQDEIPSGVIPGRLWLDTSDNEYQGTVFENLSSQLTDTEKKVDGEVSILDFEPVGNDWTDAFIQALSQSKNVYAPKGRTFLVGDVEVNGKRIYGGATIRKKALSESAFHVKGDGTIIEGLKFQGELKSGQPNADIKLGEGATNVIISNNYFNSPIYSAVSGSVDTGVGGAVYVNPVNGVIISNNIFKGYVRPLFMHSVDNLTVSNNILRDCSHDALRLRENNGFVLVEGNQFINVGDATASVAETRDAIDVFWSGANLTIVNNIVRGAGVFGFDIKGYAPDGSHGTNKVIIANNQIYKAKLSGIVMFGDANYDGQGNFKFIHGVIIANNIIQECNQANKDGNGGMENAGIRIRDLACYVNVVDNVVINNYSRGIYIHNSTAGKAKSHSLKVTGNQIINNGVSGQTSVGLMVMAIDASIISDNICSNDTSLENPFQTFGIQINSTDNGYTATKSLIVKNNICRNNLTQQIITEPNLARANCIAVFEGNIQEGTGSYNRGAWHNQRSIFFGSVAPSSAEGTFRQGDIIFNSSASANGKVGWVCTASGSPGTWKPFGVIDV